MLLSKLIIIGPSHKSSLNSGSFNITSFFVLVDELRFHPPREPLSWSGVRNAAEQPNSCYQQVCFEPKMLSPKELDLKRIKRERFDWMGCGCSTAVEHMPLNKKVMGLNPSGCWAFFSFLSLPTFHHQYSAFSHVPQGGASLTVCCEST